MPRISFVLIAALFNLRVVQPLSPQPPAWAKVAKGLKVDGPAASAGLWLSASEADDAAEHLGISTDTFDTRLAVVNLQVDNTGATAFRRLAPAPQSRHVLTAEGWVIDEEDSASVQPVVYSDQRRNAWLQRFPSQDAAAALATEKWAASFVAPLNLCPWAAASLASPGASRTIVAGSARTREDFAAAVLLAATSLLARWEEETGEDGDGDKARQQLPVPDATTAISFVVAPAFDLGFEDFYDFLVELEEDVLPETLVPEELLQGCLEPATATKAEKNGGKPKKAKPWETKKATKATAVAATREKKKAPPFPVPPLVDDEEDGEVVEADDEEEDWGDLRLGDVVTMAGFHPDWRYGSGDPAIDWEKRSPYPTISLVLTAGLGGESATERIAAANAETLSALGSEKAATLFQEAVQ